VVERLNPTYMLKGSWKRLEPSYITSDFTKLKAVIHFFLKSSDILAL